MKSDFLGLINDQRKLGQYLAYILILAKLKQDICGKAI